MNITFVVSGHEQSASKIGVPLQLPGGLTEGTVTCSVQVAVRRGTGSEVSLNLDPDKDVMAVHVANGPVLILNPETARELFLAQQSSATRGAQALTAHGYPRNWRGMGRPKSRDRPVARHVGRSARCW